MKILLLLAFCFYTTNAFQKLWQTNKGTPSFLESSNRIIGGEVARAGEFPWMAAIYKQTADGRYFCSGTLIADQWLMTAAQCVDGAQTFTIQLGSNQLSSTDENRLLLAAEEYLINPSYNASTLWTDIGLIKLRAPITFTDYIQPIVYASYGYLYPGKPVLAAGWGQTSDDEAGLVNDLRVVEISIISSTQCQNYYGDFVFPSTICAEGNYNEGTCFGDIGGALVTEDVAGNHSVAVAVASWLSPNGCESVDPSGYVRVDTYNQWITETIRDNSS